MFPPEFGMLGDATMTGGRCSKATVFCMPSSGQRFPGLSSWHAKDLPKHVERSAMHEAFGLPRGCSDKVGRMLLK